MQRCFVHVIFNCGTWKNKGVGDLKFITCGDKSQEEGAIFIGG